MTYTSFSCCLVSVAIPIATAVISQATHGCFSDSDVRDNPRTETCGEVEGVWQSEAKSQNQSDAAMCQTGKNLPQLYLLGPPKAGTTSLSRDLASAGVKCLEDRKENFFWVDHRNADTVKEVQKSLENVLKPCSETSRSVVADFTPENIAIPTVPKLMRSVYGSRYRNIRFVLMLREPLSRLQSHYYFGHEGAGKKVQPLQFQRDVEGLLTKGIPHAFTESLHPEEVADLSILAPISSMAVYCKMGGHLSKWLGSFEAEQFMIIPYKSYLKKATDMKVCKGLSQHIGYSIGCVPRISSSVSTPHPSVADDVSEEVRNRFADALRDDKRTLAGILERDSKKGMKIVYYNGGDGSDWLDSNW